ncbi:MAG: hypothetical protein Kow0031_09430 [Anaerolineae bacterium]
MTTNQYAISIMSKDRVGIVHEVAQAIAALHGDIADLSQTVLRGYFTMILFAAFPESVTTEAVRKQLLGLNDDSPHPLEISLQAVGNGLPPEPTDRPDKSDAYVLTASGPDRIGFVASVTAFCAEHNLNILDLSTTVTEGTYIMVLLIDLSRCRNCHRLRDELARFGEETNLNLVLQHYDIFRATNEISRL